LALKERNRKQKRGVLKQLRSISQGKKELKTAILDMFHVLGQGRRTQEAELGMVGSWRPSAVRASDVLFQTTRSRDSGNQAKGHVWRQGLSLDYDPQDIILYIVGNYIM